MPHQDCSHSHHLAGCRAADLKKALLWLLGSVFWSGVAFRGDCTWTPQLLASVTLLWSWSDEGTLHQRFFAARRIAVFLFPGQAEPATTYQAFLKILRRWTVPLVDCLQHALHQRISADFTDHFRKFGFIAFGVDGSNGTH